MPTGILIDAAKRNIDALALSKPHMAADVAAATGCQDIELGAKLPDGSKIYLGLHALLTSQSYFRHCLVSTPLPGRGVLVADQDLSPDHIRPLIDFINHDEAFPNAASPFDHWMKGVALQLPGVSLTCQGHTCRW